VLSSEKFSGRLEGEAELGVQEPPAAHKAFARVLAIDDVVDRGEIILAVALGIFRRGVLPRHRRRLLHALGGRRMRGQEVLRARIERGLAGLQLGIAFHRSEEARRAIGVEMRMRGDAHSHLVGVDLLRAREIRHRHLVLGDGEGGHLGIVAHVGDDAVDDRGLPGLVLALGGVLGQHMRHLVGQHRGQFRGVVGERNQPARDIELAGRQREGVDRARIEDGDLVGLVGPLGGRDETVHGPADERFELGIVIDAAVGGEDALMLLFGRRRRDDGPVRLDDGGRGGDRGGLETAHVAAGGQRRCRQQQSRHSPKPAAHSHLAPSR
jgi:hypothetical protein